jgi:hypothetical protein
MLKILAEATEVIGQAAAAKVFQELSELAAIDRVSSQGSIALVQCSAFSEAARLVEKTIEVAAIAQRYWFDRILLSWPQCGNPLQISASFAVPKQNPEFFIPKLNLTFPGFLASEKPIYINSFNTLKVLFANEAALRCQKRSPSTFFGQSVYELNYPEELDRRVKRIKKGNLIEYSYKAFRWNNGNSKKIMNFCSNFGQIKFGEEICWFSSPLETIDTGALA